MMKDKLYHILAGAMVAAFVGLPCYLENVDLFAGIWASMASALVVAITKEFCDCDYIFDVWHFDWKDIGFTIIGAVVVALFVVGLHFGKG